MSVTDRCQERRSLYLPGNPTRGGRTPVNPEPPGNFQLFITSPLAVITFYNHWMQIEICWQPIHHILAAICWAKLHVLKSYSQNAPDTKITLKCSLWIYVKWYFVDIMWFFCVVFLTWNDDKCNKFLSKDFLEFIVVQTAIYNKILFVHTASKLLL